MSQAVVICPNCGESYEPAPEDIRKGTWRRCPQCSKPQPTSITTKLCQGCDKPIRTVDRTLCVECAGYVRQPSRMLLRATTLPSTKEQCHGC